MGQSESIYTVFEISPQIILTKNLDEEKDLEFFEDLFYLLTDEFLLSSFTPGFVRILISSKPNNVFVLIKRIYKDFILFLDNPYPLYYTDIITRIQTLSIILSVFFEASFSDIAYNFFWKTSESSPTPFGRELVHTIMRLLFIVSTGSPTEKIIKVTNLLVVNKSILWAPGIGTTVIVPKHLHTMLLRSSLLRLVLLLNSSVLYYPSNDPKDDEGLSRQHQWVVEFLSPALPYQSEFFLSLINTVFSFNPSSSASAATKSHLSFVCFQVEKEYVSLAIRLLLILVLHQPPSSLRGVIELNDPEAFISSSTNLVTVAHPSTTNPSTNNNIFTYVSADASSSGSSSSDEKELLDDNVDDVNNNSKEINKINYYETNFYAYNYLTINNVKQLNYILGSVISYAQTPFLYVNTSFTAGTEYLLLLYELIKKNSKAYDIFTGGKGILPSTPPAPSASSILVYTISSSSSTSSSSHSSTSPSVSTSSPSSSSSSSSSSPSLSHVDLIRSFYTIALPILSHSSFLTYSAPLAKGGRADITSKNLTDDVNMNYHHSAPSLFSTAYLTNHFFPDIKLWGTNYLYEGFYSQRKISTPQKIVDLSTGGGIDNSSSSSSSSSSDSSFSSDPPSSSSFGDSSFSLSDSSSDPSSSSPSSSSPPPSELSDLNAGLSTSPHPSSSSSSTPSSSLPPSSASSAFSLLPTPLTQSFFESNISIPKLKYIKRRVKGETEKRIKERRESKVDLGPLPHITLELNEGKEISLISALTANYVMEKTRLQVEVVQCIISILLPLSSNRNVNTTMNETYDFASFTHTRQGRGRGTGEGDGILINTEWCLSDSLILSLLDVCDHVRSFDLVLVENSLIIIYNVTYYLNSLSRSASFQLLNFFGKIAKRDVLFNNLNYCGVVKLLLECFNHVVMYHAGENPYFLYFLELKSAYLEDLANPVFPKVEEEVKENLIPSSPSSSSSSSASSSSSSASSSFPSSFTSYFLQWCKSLPLTPLLAVTRYIKRNMKELVEEAIQKQEEREMTKEQKKNKEKEEKEMKKKEKEEKKEKEKEEEERKKKGKKKKNEREGEEKEEEEQIKSPSTTTSEEEKEKKEEEEEEEDNTAPPPILSHLPSQKKSGISLFLNNTYYSFISSVSYSEHRPYEEREAVQKIKRMSFVQIVPKKEKVAIKSFTYDENYYNWVKKLVWCIVYFKMELLWDANSIKLFPALPEMQIVGIDGSKTQEEVKREKGMEKMRIDLREGDGVEQLVNEKKKKNK